ncbi:MAG: twitch domain-containing radical SAM protein, partial [Pseudomonadota bacterium]
MFNRIISRLTGHRRPKQLPESFCILPWVQTHVSVSGAMSPCCEFEGEYANLSDATLSDGWKSQQLAKLRKSFLKGQKPKACRKCFEREASGERSIRLSCNKSFQGHYARVEAANKPLQAATPFPVSLDLRFSNLCNFKCRSCWHGASSKWFADGKALGITIGDKAEISSFTSVDDLMRQCEGGLGKLELLYFAGGEPLLLGEHYALLEKLVSLGRTDVGLTYNTNMSVLSFRGQSILDLWTQFDTVKMQASVDATGALGANMRSGFKCDTFVRNIQRVRAECPHVEISFGVTVSIMNIMALPDLFDALEQSCGATLPWINTHSLQDPSFYRTQVLPEPLKQQTEAELRSYLDKTSKRTDITAEDYGCLEKQFLGLL